MNKCIVCEKEIKEPILPDIEPGEEIVIHYGLTMHKECEENFIYYDNYTHRNYISCCGIKLDIIVEVRQGKYFGYAKCLHCGKLYITERFPKRPRPQKMKAPHRYSEEERREKKGQI